jgi:Domain of unknown function (DUF4214)
VLGLYEDLLSRAPLNFESSAAIAALTAGQTPLQVVQSITSTTEYQQDYINSLYVLYLRRSAAASETAPYIAELAGGTSDAAVIGAILGSDEYYARFAG